MQLTTITPPLFFYQSTRKLLFLSLIIPIFFVFCEPEKKDDSAYNAVVLNALLKPSSSTIGGTCTRRWN